MPADTARVEMSRVIAATAERVFSVVADPRRHAEFDGSDMLRGAADGSAITDVGQIFTMKMHRMGRDYIMINTIVEFERDHKIMWEPAPGDLDTAGGDPARIGVPSGYRWGFLLAPESDAATVVTSVFDCGPEENRWILEKEDGAWINGSTSIRESMTHTLQRLADVCES